MEQESNEVEITLVNRVIIKYKGVILGEFKEAYSRWGITEYKDESESYILVLNAGGILDDPLFGKIFGMECKRRIIGSSEHYKKTMDRIDEQVNL